MSSLSRTWGTEPDERQMEFPCDRFMERYDDAVYRGVTIYAKAEIIYKWLCQIRVAPYSYDWLDNLGRKSPQNLIPGIDELAVGQTMMIMFDVVDFEADKYITIRYKEIIPKFLGDGIVSYLIHPQNDGKCRLLVKGLLRYPVAPIGWFMRPFFPWGDLIMMRRQLLNFKRLAEQTGIGIVGQNI